MCVIYVCVIQTHTQVCHGDNVLSIIPSCATKLTKRFTFTDILTYLYVNGTYLWHTSLLQGRHRDVFHRNYLPYTELYVSLNILHLSLSYAWHIKYIQYIYYHICRYRWNYINMWFHCSLPYFCHISVVEKAIHLPYYLPYQQVLKKGHISLSYIHRHTNI